MPDKDEWANITGKAVTRLRAPKVVPVPESIVKLAQRSYDGVKVDGEDELRHVLRHTFDSVEKAEAFAKLMRKAGDHTTPITSVSVAIDPDRDGDDEVDPKTVAWKAGKRRGRNTTV